MLTKDGGQAVQAFPLLEGKVNLVGGAGHVVNKLIHCAAPGNIIVTWPTGGTATIPMVAGQDFAFTGTIEIVAAGGTFHIA